MNEIDTQILNEFKELKSPAERLEFVNLHNSEYEEDSEIYFTPVFDFESWDGAQLQEHLHFLISLHKSLRLPKVGCDSSNTFSYRTYLIILIKHDVKNSRGYINVSKYDSKSRNTERIDFEIADYKLQD